jgi:hypothetical protein
VIGALAASGSTLAAAGPKSPVSGCIPAAFQL